MLERVTCHVSLTSAALSTASGGGGTREELEKDEDEGDELAADDWLPLALMRLYSCAVQHYNTLLTYDNNTTQLISS